MSDVEALIDVNYVDHQGLGGAKRIGPAGFRQVVAAARAATPSLQVAIQDVVTGGDRVVARLRWYASASGQPHERETIDILRIVDGRLVEHWGAVARGPQEASRGPTAAAARTNERLRNPDGVRAAYDVWAATYDGDRNLTPFTTTITRSQSLRLSGACVVEIGCGTGAKWRGSKATGNTTPTLLSLAFRKSASSDLIEKLGQRTDLARLSSTKE